MQWFICSHWWTLKRYVYMLLRCFVIYVNVDDVIGRSQRRAAHARSRVSVSGVTCIERWLIREIFITRSWSEPRSEVPHCCVTPAQTGNSSVQHSSTAVVATVERIRNLKQRELQTYSKKVWTLVIAPLTWVRLVTSSALQSRKWQLIGMSQWCRSTLRMWPSIARANGQLNPRCS